MSYKKRARNGWSAGKKYKEASNRGERQHEKQEVKEELEIEFQGDDFRYKYKGKNKIVSDRKKLEKEIYYHEKWARIFGQWNWNIEYTRNLSEKYKRKAEELKKQLEELENENR